MGIQSKWRQSGPESAQSSGDFVSDVLVVRGQVERPVGRSAKILGQKHFDCVCRLDYLTHLRVTEGYRLFRHFDLAFWSFGRTWSSKIAAQQTIRVNPTWSNTKSWSSDPPVLASDLYRSPDKHISISIASWRKYPRQSQDRLPGPIAISGRLFLPSSVNDPPSSLSSK